MAELTLMASPVLGGFDLKIGTNRLRERDDLAIVSVATPLGGDAALAAALQSAFLLDMPTPKMEARSDAMHAIRTAPDQLFLVFPHTASDAEPLVQSALAGAGYTTDQTDAWVVLEVSGPDTLTALERICPLDLHPDAFPDGASGRTLMEHLSVIILRLGPERFLLMSASSSAASFAHAVETSYRNVI